MTSKKANVLREKIRASFGDNAAPEQIPDGAPAAKCANGTFIGKMKGDVAVFRGIPFAVPPVGELRWKRPEPARASEGIFAAYYNGKSPIQTEWISERASFYPQSEDCLYLNVWCAPSGKDLTQGEKAVMVFFHGGSYGWGGTADPLYDGEAFVNYRKDIVLVTAAYRTGIMGFIDFSEVPGGENFKDAPNLGLYDQLEALNWVKNNISAFGGDPSKVTIFGESAGGGSVSLLPFFPEAKGLFKRIIAESGSVALTFSKDECLPMARKLLKESGAKTMDDLMALPEEELVRANEPINISNNFPERDGEVIPFDAYAPYAEGKVSDIDLMIGTNANEFNYWISELGGLIPFAVCARVMYYRDRKLFFEKEGNIAKDFISSLKGRKLWRIVELYNEILFRAPAIKQAEGHSANGGKTFVYYWDEPSAHPFRGSCHAVELAYVFGNTDDTVYTGRTADRRLAETVMDMWANFANTGDPSTKDCPWPAYSPESRNTMILEKSSHAEKDFLEERRTALDPLLKYRLNGSYEELPKRIPILLQLEGLFDGIGLSIRSLFK
ncbi:MAG: carboxylesterase family protein [Clostridia bacterium]|nr:carboxylesterase family protein [Clostridia bacterium]